MHSNFKLRLHVISAGMAGLMLLLIAKLFFVQVVHESDYRAMADRQYATPASDVFDRGSIFFTDKDGQEVSAATLTAGFKVAIDPQKITDPEALYAKLSPVLALDHDTFIAQASKHADPYEEVAIHLTKEVADQVSALAIPGVSIYKQKWRYYPGNDLASRTLGFVAYKGNDFGGRYGLERYYDDVLSRNGSDSLSINFFAEIFSNLGKTILQTQPKEGDVVTTLEPDVQAYLDNTMQQVSTQWHTDEAGGIVIDPKTGAIIAMSAMPDFDLNDFSKVSDPLTFANPLVENVYELGSIVKTLTMSAGLDAGVVTPDSTYDDKGSVTLNGKTIHNFDKIGRGVIPMQEVLNESLNTGATYVMQQLGQERFRNYMLAFGLGEKTGIDMPGEVKSLISNLYSPRDIDYATASFGQGIALTPIAAVRAFSSLANGGTLITPHLASAIHYTDGTTQTIAYPAGQQIITKKTADTITQMLVTVVDKALFNGAEKMDHYSIAAKTGTAQIAMPGGGYYSDRYLHSMYAYFPAYDPRFLVFLYDVNPKGVNYAANTIGHPIMDMAKFLINYYNVPGDR